MILKVIIFLWRYNNMWRECNSWVKGIGLGIIGGMIISHYSQNMLGTNKMVKRKAGRAVHAVGDFIESVPYIFR